MGVEIKTPFKGESKSCTCKESKTRYSFTTSHRQESFLSSLGAQGSIMHSKVACHHSKHPPHSSPMFYLLKTTPCDMEHSLGQLECSVFPPNYLCTHSLVSAGVVSEAEKPLSLCKHCSAVGYQHLWVTNSVSRTWPKHNPTSATMKKNYGYASQNQHILKVCVCWI